MANMKAATSRALDRMRTGIEGFDEIMAGGLPRGGITVVIGGAGTGKTTLGLHILARGASTYGEPGILVAFEESTARILANSAGFAWGGEALDGAPLHVIDAQLSQSVEKSGEFDLVGLLAIVAATAKQVGARRIVFDGLDMLLSYLGDGALVRREVFRLRDWVYEGGLTAIVTAKGDASEARPAPEYDFLQFMADCVVTMHHRVSNSTALRFLRVAKYRGARHSANEYPFTITQSGLEVAGGATVELAHSASTERISTGVQRLDSMLAGGYHRGSSVLITGVPGTAKTTLAAAFAEAAARRGERTLFISFDEAPEQVTRNVASIGLLFRPLVASGALHLHAFRGRAENPEAHVARVRALLRELKPTNVVVDPLSALSQHPGDSAAAFQVLDLAKSAGMTLLSTSLLGNNVPLAETTPLNISTIADTWLHVSYVNQGGERNRALTIIKARGTGHSNQVRELVLADTGVTLADVYAVGGEVLMGTLRWERENDVRRSRAMALNDVLIRQRKAELSLAGTKAELERLTREQILQEAELEQLRNATAAEREERTVEENELLQRRCADTGSPSGRAAMRAAGGPPA